MYEAIKRYETYVARNKRLEGKGASSSAGQPKAAGHTSGYKPRFHKTTPFAATIPEAEDNGPCHHESSSQEGADPFGTESSQEDDEGLFIPSYLEEALPVLQVKMARAMRAQEVETRRCHSLRSLPGSRCFLWRPLCSHRLPFWILFRMLGLTPLLVLIYCQGEYEVRDDVPVVAGRRPEVYRHLGPLHQTLGKLLLLVFQHGCGGLTQETGKGDLTNRVPSKQPVPHSMEPEISEGEGSHGFTSFCHGLLSCHIQQDGMLRHNWYHVTHLRDSDKYKAGGTQPVRQLHTGAHSVPHMQMHVGSTERLRGNVVRLVHEPHPH